MLAGGMLFDGGVSAPTTANVSIDGTVATSGDALTLGNVTLTNDAILDATNAGADAGGGAISWVL